MGGYTWVMGGYRGQDDRKRVLNIHYSLNKKSTESRAPGMSITSAAFQ